MRNRTTLLGLLAVPSLALLSACGGSSSSGDQANVSASAKAAQAAAESASSKPPPPDKPPPPAKLDKVPRLDFNKLAAELDLPIFWTEDANKNGAIDPGEVVSLWGISESAPKLVEDGKFTTSFYKAYDTIVDRKNKVGRLPGTDGGPPDTSADEQRRRDAVITELGQGRPSLVRSDFRQSSAEDKALVDHIMKAAVIIEKIYGKQKGIDAMVQQVPAYDTESRMLFYRNQGPWCEAPLTEKNLDCNALPSKPPRVSGLYPAELQKDPKFCEKLQARKDHDALLNTFSIVTDEASEMKAIPYNVAYKGEMEGVSQELKAASAAITSKEEAALKAYLDAAAQSFVDNNWVPADEAWAKMNNTNSKFYLRIAPDEVYFEPCSLHAGFHVSFARINQDSVEWQNKLEPVKTEMEEALAKLAGAPYTARKVTFHLPDFIDIILNAGDSRSALGATIGQSLPNVGPVANEGRGRTVAMTNLYTDKDSEAAFFDQVKSGFCQSAMPLIAFDPKASTMSTVLHEAAHNLGPAHEYKVGGKADKDVFGGALASTLEELKAQTSALYFADWLVDKKLLDKKQAEMAHARDVVWAFGHISQGMYTGDGKPKPYSQLASVQMGSLLAAGALKWNADENAANGTDKGCFSIDMAKFPAAVADLEKQVLAIKGKGDKAAAQKLLEEHVDKDNDWKKLRATIQERWLRAPKASFVYAIER